MERHPHPTKHEQKRTEQHPQQKSSMPQQTQTTPPVMQDTTQEMSQEDMIYANDVTTLLSWHAAGRPFRQRSFEYFFNSFLIMLALEIILFLFSQYLLMLVIFSFVFLSFALAVVPPRPFYYKVTNQGIRIEDHVFIWEELYDFYFMRQHDQTILHIRTKAFFPGELIVTLGDVPSDQIKSVLLPYLPYREFVEPSFMEKAGDWLEQNFPLEKRVT